MGGRDCKVAASWPKAPHPTWPRRAQATDAIAPATGASSPVGDEAATLLKVEAAATDVVDSDADAVAVFSPADEPHTPAAEASRLRLREEGCDRDDQPAPKRVATEQGLRPAVGDAGPRGQEPKVLAMDVPQSAPPAVTLALSS